MPVYFYLEIVWSTTVVTAAVLFYYATYLSNSIYGGFITILFFFFNHNECTRVQWTPPLRETFAYPMLLFQMYSVTMAIRKYTKHDTDKEPAALRNRTRQGLFMVRIETILLFDIHSISNIDIFQINSIYMFNIIINLNYLLHNIICLKYNI